MFVVAAGAPDLLEESRTKRQAGRQLTSDVVHHKRGGSDALILKIIAALMLEYGQLECHGSVEFGAALSKKWRRHSEQRAESSKRQVLVPRYDE